MSRHVSRLGRRVPGLLGIAAATALLALLAGCGSSESDSGTSVTEKAAKEVGSSGDSGEFTTIADVCGDEPITVGYADGYGANSWRKIARAELEAEADKCPSIEKVIYTDAQGSTQKAISDINSLASQGVGAMVVLPDAGPAVIPAMRAAMRQGIDVVIAPGDIGGKEGQDYVAAVYDSPQANGRAWGQWMVDQLHGKGGVVFLGGTPANPVSPLEAEGVEEVFAENPGMKLLAGPVDTNWDAAETQKVTSGLLTKYPQIDGVISDYGGSTIGAIRAFEAAGKPVPPIATNDINELGCAWKAADAKGDGFALATVSSRPWITRLALRHAVGAKEGIEDEEPTVVKLPLFEDSSSKQEDLAVRCDEQLPPDAILSSTLSPQQLAELFGT